MSISADSIPTLYRVTVSTETENIYSTTIWSSPSDIISDIEELREAWSAEVEEDVDIDYWAA